MLESLFEDLDSILKHIATTENNSLNFPVRSSGESLMDRLALYTETMSVDEGKKNNTNPLNEIRICKFVNCIYKVNKQFISH